MMIARFWSAFRNRIIGTDHSIKRIDDKGHPVVENTSVTNLVSEGSSSGAGHTGSCVDAVSAGDPVAERTLSAAQEHTAGRVSDEHTASFPSIGQITTVQAIKVTSGRPYHLPDSMTDRDAFTGPTDAWTLKVDALPRSDLGCRKRLLCEMLLGQAQLGATHTETEREEHRVIKRRDTAPAADILCVLNEQCSNGDVHISAATKEVRHLAPCVEQLKQGDPSEKQVGEKETWTAKVCDGERSSNGADLVPPPCADEATKEGDSSEDEAIQHKVEEKVCNPESSSHWTHFPSPDESMTEGDSLENDVRQHEVEEKEPWNREGNSHWNDPIEWTDAEQRALEKRRRPGNAVRKMPNSQVARPYGFRRVTEEKKREKKKKNNEDPNRPKKTPNAFFCFLEEFRPNYKLAHPYTYKEYRINTEAGKKWRSMTDDDKAPYISKARELMVEARKMLPHDDELQAYG